MQSLLYTNRFFYLSYLLSTVIGISILTFVGYSNFQLFINKNITYELTIIFSWITKLAEGIIAGGILVYFLFKNLKHFFIFLISWLTTTLLVQLLKKVVFSGSLRPAKFFESIPDFKTIEGITYHHHFSFPSGHSADIFCCLCLLALAIKNKKIGILLCILALVVAFSRVYLSQHFLQDIIAGSVIGVSISSLSYLKLIKIYWTEKGLIEMFRK